MNAPVQRESLAQPSLEDDPFFRHLIGQTHKSEAMRAALVKCCSAWVKGQLEQQRRAAPAVGLNSERLVELGQHAGIRGVEDATVVRFARSVLGAATNSHASTPASTAIPNSAARRIEMMAIEARQLEARADIWHTKAVAFMESLERIASTSSDDTARTEAAAVLRAAFPKKGTAWTS